MDNGKEIQATSGTLAYKIKMADSSTPVENDVIVKYKGNRLTDGQVPITVKSNTIEVELSGNQKWRTIRGLCM